MTDNSLTTRHTAGQILEQAQQLALKEKQPFDTLHVLLVALTSKDQGTRTLDPFVEAQTRNQLGEYIKTRLRYSARKASSDGRTSELNQCSAAWTLRAKEQHLILNDALIVLTILNVDALAKKFMSVDIDIDALLKALETRLEQEPERSPAIINSPNGSGLVEFTAQEERTFRDFYGLVEYQKAEVTIDRDMHDVAMKNFLNLLGAAASPTNEDFVVVYGQHGSPLNGLADVLAYRLEHDHFIGMRTPLKDYKKVYSVSIDKLQLLAKQIGQDSSSPARILRRIKRQAREDHAIIILTHLQKMSTRKRSDPVGDGIKFELANPGGAVIAGFFEYDQDQPPHSELTLGLANTRLVGVEAYNRENTLKFIKRYYAPRWKDDGYKFKDEAFDSIIALEPGAWIDKRRKTLPYLATGLGNDTILTASDGDVSIKSTADQAWSDLNNLLIFEQLKAEPDLRAQFDDTLKQAEQDILHLRQQATPANVDGLKQLTRAHVIAQLVCHNDSEFHYPGFTPYKQQARRAKRS